MAFNPFENQESQQEMFTATCPSCGRESEQRIWTLVNARINPELASKVIDGTIFDITCPHCGFASYGGQTFRYVDPDHNASAFLVPDEAMGKTVCEMLKLKEMPASGSTTIKRVVSDPQDLSGRALAFQHNLDDRVLELIKVDLVKESMLKGSIADDDEILGVVFSGIDDVSLDFYVDCDTKMVTSKLKRGAYDKYRAALMKSSAAEDQPYDIGPLWAMQTLEMLYNEGLL